MHSRRRSADMRTAITGTLWKKVGSESVTVTGWADVGLQRVTDDVVGRLDGDNTFHSTLKETWVPRINGTGLSTQGEPLVVFDNYPLDAHPDPQMSDTIGSIEMIELVVGLLAKTNPGTSGMSLPTFVGELRDLPGLVHGYGKTLIKSLASAHLSWRWAVRPMVNDLLCLWKFMESAERRFVMLRRLQASGTLRRRIVLKSSKRQTEANLILQSDGALIRGTRKTLYTNKVWGTVRWKLLPGASAFPTLSATKLYELAALTEMGLASSFELLGTAWELMPWSWMIDWFVKCQDYIKALNNTIPVVPTRVNVMYTSTSKSTYTYTWFPSWVSLSGTHYEAEISKHRVPWDQELLPETPVLGLPVLKAGQWSILASLQANRFDAVKRYVGSIPRNFERMRGKAAINVVEQLLLRRRAASLRGLQ